MALHCLLLFSTLWYLLTVVVCLCAIAALDLAKKSTDGKCKLFSDPDVQSKTGSEVCDICMYELIFSALYCFLMGLYNGYALYVAFKETHIGRTMWVMPWMLANSLFFLLTLCVSAAYSIGFSVTCSKFAQTSYGKITTKGCIDAFDYATRRPYDLYQTTQISIWISTVLWALSFGLTVIRYIRNRKARSTQSFSNANSDRNPIALTEPTA